MEAGFIFLKKRMIVLTQAFVMSSALFLSGCSQNNELAVKDNTVIVKTATAVVYAPIAMASGMSGQMNRPLCEITYLRLICDRMATMS